MNPTIRIDQFGAADVMKLVDMPVGNPAAGEVRIRHHACGINYIDVYQRSGLYPNALPLSLGMEGAGVVEAVGDGVAHLKVGDRVAYASQPPGSYCAVRVMPAKCVVVLPEALSFAEGAGMMLKGMTTAYLLERTLPQGGLAAGDAVLFHAAAGGVGLIACQWAKALGLKLIATAGSDEKCKLALEHGAAHAINYSREDFVARTRELTGGAGVKVVYDSIGKDTFDKSLDCLRPFGLMVTYGNASGPVPPFNLGTLGAKGSIYVTRPTLFTHIATREGTQAIADRLFAMTTSGKVKIRVDRRYKLADVVQAHKDLEARLTTGSSVLEP